MEYKIFIFHSQKSISSYQKSIIPLFSLGIGCYNTHTSSAADKCFCCKIEDTNFHLRRSRPLFLGGIAMKKNAKQLLINAMEEYGNTLILSDRF